jgi:hypothetical protein
MIAADAYEVDPGRRYGSIDVVGDIGHVRPSKIKVADHIEYISSGTSARRRPIAERPFVRHCASVPSTCISSRLEEAL